MQTQIEQLDWSVTDEKVSEALRRIIQTADPLQVLVFGSRARGDYRPDSDLDLAVILDCTDEETRSRLPFTVFEDIGMEIDLVVASQAKYDLHRPWLNSIFHTIDSEGIVLYDREHPQSACPNAVHTSPGGRILSAVPAA